MDFGFATAKILKKEVQMMKNKKINIFNQFDSDRKNQTLLPTMRYKKRN